MCLVDVFVYVCLFISSLPYMVNKDEYIIRVTRLNSENAPNAGNCVVYNSAV